MKVLWFSNTPANGIKYFQSDLVKGGWLQSLDELLQEEVELHVAFYYPGHFDKFKYGKTTYYPISKKKWKWTAVKASLFNKIVNEEDLDFYLALIKKVNPDIIHFHGTENPFGIIQQYTTYPVVISLQGILNVYMHKYSTGIEDKYLKTTKKFLTTKLKDYLFNHSFIKTKKLYGLNRDRETKILINSKFVIGRTDWDRKVTRVLAPKSEYFHCDEILRKSFYDYQWEAKNVSDQFLIFTTNDNNPFKGFETVCESLTLLNKLNFNVTWRVAGIGPTDLIVQVVKRKLGENYPHKNLVLLGKQSEDKIINSLLDSHLYVMPSHIENSPNNLCEAMILGLPCLATFAGGTSTILENKVTGLLIQDGDPWAMAGTIIEIKENYDEAIEMGVRARKVALIRHDREKNINNLIAIYSKIINQNGKGKD